MIWPKRKMKSQFWSITLVQCYFFFSIFGSTCSKKCNFIMISSGVVFSYCRTFVMPSRMCINPIHNNKGILHKLANATAEERLLFWSFVLSVNFVDLIFTVFIFFVQKKVVFLLWIHNPRARVMWRWSINLPYSCKVNSEEESWTI